MRPVKPATGTCSRSLRFLYNTAAGRILLRPLVSRPVSVIAGKFLDTKVSCLFIKRFIKSGGIDMTDYEERKFSSFNDFFTRRVKPRKQDRATGMRRRLCRRVTVISALTE